LIILYHLHTKITEVVNLDNQKIKFDVLDTIAEGLHKLAAQFPESKIVWCSLDCKEQLNLKDIEQLFHHNKMLLSFNPSKHHFFDSHIGYAEQSLFINVNKKVRYPTWQMSSAVGVVHASLLNEIKDHIKWDANFDYYLSSLAKLCMPLGLLCYSEPKLLKQIVPIATPIADIYMLFRFVKQHYKTRWVFLLWLNLMMYERKFTWLPLLFSLFYKHRNIQTLNLDGITVESTKKVIDRGTLDVIIPTIGRKKYLYDVLCDLRNQTYLPKNVIVIEQNPQENSISELDYLTSEKWPFEINHTFMHQAGVCNARNIALAKVQSEWVFMADDDNRFESNLLEDIFKKIEQFGNQVVTTAYPQKNEYKSYKRVVQWPTFGAGNSFIRVNLLDNVKFNMALEFGYGEDGDFGMQLRNKGIDVLYLPEPEILHLKAPIGGFRTKPVLLWSNDEIQPKPSPTVMLYNLLHNTKEQLMGYKTTLFIKYYKRQKIKNPIQYYLMFQKQWKRSLFWANELKGKAIT